MKIKRIINQNIFSIVIIILVIVFVIAIVQLLNYIASQNKKEKNSNVQNEVIKYENESKAIISNDNVEKNKSEKYGDIIESFLKNCISGNIEEAYDMLSQDCKDIYYSTIEDFQNNYINYKFDKNKKYSFQAWITGAKNIYQVKIYEDMLSTGKATNSYIVDYYTIEKEDGNYKLNINNFIDKVKMNTENEKDGINIKINSAEIYKENIILNINVLNNSEKTIKIDSKSKTNTVYILDDKDVKFKSLMYELIDDDLIVEAGEEKEIKIKFNIIYRDDLNLKKLYFTNIIKDYDEYSNDKNNYKDVLTMAINL